MLPHPLLCRLPTTALCLDASQCCYLLSSTPLLLIWSKLCMLSMKPRRTDVAGRSVTFTTHWATIWDSSLAELCHATPSAPVRSILSRGRCNFPASGTKMSKDHLWKWQAPKHPLPQCFWCHTIICWGFKILIPDGAFLALEKKTSEVAPCICLYAWPDNS